MWEMSMKNSLKKFKQHSIDLLQSTFSPLTDGENSIQIDA